MSSLTVAKGALLNRPQDGLARPLWPKRTRSKEKEAYPKGGQAETKAERKVRMPKAAPKSAIARVCCKKAAGDKIGQSSRQRSQPMA